MKRELQKRVISYREEVKAEITSQIKMAIDEFKYAIKEKTSNWLPSELFELSELWATATGYCEQLNIEIQEEKKLINDIEDEIYEIITKTRLYKQYLNLKNKVCLKFSI